MDLETTHRLTIEVLRQVLADSFLLAPEHPSEQLYQQGKREGLRLALLLLTREDDVR